MAEKQLIIAVEGTAAMGPHWSNVVSDYLEKIIRSFCVNELNGQKTSNSTVELALVTFNTHGSHCGCLVQRSGWTRDKEYFLQWLSAVPFSGGGFNDVAIAEGLSEALMMFSIGQNGNQGQQNVDCQRHCILIAASNPYPLSTPVFRPQVQNLEQSENIDAQTENRLSDAETIAKSFAQCLVSLSVISPKQLPKLRAIYNAGSRNPWVNDPPVDNGKNPYYLVLLSENFLEARAALSLSGVPSLPSNQSPVKVDMAPVTSVTGPPTSMPSVNGSLMNRQPISAANMPPATVKVEPSTISGMVPGPTFPQIPSVAGRAASQGVPLQTSSPSPASQDIITNGDNVPDLKPVVSNVTQPLRPVGPAPANVNILNNLSQARQAMQHSAALPIGQNPIGMHMSNMISSGMASSTPAQNILPSGQPVIPPMAGSGTLTQVTQTPAHASFTAASSTMPGNSSIGASQPMNNLQVGVGMPQSVPAMSQGNLSGTQMVQTGMGINQNMMGGLGGPAVASSGTGTMIPTPGMPQQVQSVVQPLGVNNNSAATIPMPQQPSNAPQQAPSKYVKVWEGNLSGQRQGQPVFITRLEGYRNATASETLAANWPATMQIVRLISQDHMNNKQYVGKADFLVFRAMNQHGFLGQLQEKKLCAVIQLPSQTLLLSVSDKACRLIGMLFPGDMVVFKPQVPNQQQQHPQLQQQQIPQLQQQQQQQQQQIPQLQQQIPQLQQQQQQPQIPQLQQQPQQMQQLQQQQQMPQLQQQQQMPQLQQLQQQQMVGPGMGQAYVQGPGRSQLVSQGQSTSQVPPSMPGGGFMG